MSRDNWALVFLILYLLGFMAVAIGLFLWKVKRRGGRTPLEFKLLRGPGETLRRRMAAFEEDFLRRIALGALAPLLVALGALWLLPKIKPETWTFVWIYAGITGLVSIGLLGFMLRWTMQGMERYRNDRLGYLGERAVGEVLESLLSSGYRVFHDVPAVAGDAKFNVDHVAVGPNGIFAIETKTRRKGRARPNREDHKVAYDGKRLSWPWGEDNFGLKNAEDRARWLTEWLCKVTGLALNAQPVLVLPGWYVVAHGLGPVVVVNHKMLPGAILRNARRLLSAEQMDLIARQLDLLCRDVDD
jgi:hypothetical protein